MEMDNEKKEELLNTYLLHYNMIEVSELASLTITELEFLMKSAQIYHEKKMFAGDNFLQKIEVFREAMTGKIKGLKQIYAAWDTHTGYPHVMGDGTIMLFTEEEYARKAAEHYKEEKLDLDMRVITKENQPLLWADCYWWGMEKISFDIGNYAWQLGRGELLPPPDYSNLPKIQIPVINPALVFSMVQHRQLLFEEKKDDKWKKAEQYLCDRMLRETVKAKYLCPVKMNRPGGEEPDAEGKITLKEDTTIQFAFLSDKENRNWLPAFTDWQSLQKLYDKKEWDAQIMDYASILAIAGEHGIVINPGGMETRVDENRKKILDGYYKRRQHLELEMASGKLEEKKPGFYIGEPQEEPMELKQLLSEYLKKQKEIKKAYLAIKVEHGEDISYLLVAEFKGESKAVFTGIAEAVRGELKELRMDMHEADAPMMELLGEIKPFYKKSFLGL